MAVGRLIGDWGMNFEGLKGKFSEEPHCLFLSDHGCVVFPCDECDECVHLLACCLLQHRDFSGDVRHCPVWWLLDPLPGFDSPSACPSLARLPVLTPHQVSTSPPGPALPPARPLSALLPHLPAHLVPDSSPHRPHPL